MVSESVVSLEVTQESANGQVRIYFTGFRMRASTRGPLGRLECDERTNDWTISRTENNSPRLTLHQFLSSTAKQSVSVWLPLIFPVVKIWI